MQFIDLKTQYNRIEENINGRINDVLKHGQYILGPEVFELEEKLADFTNTKYCISVSSGTDALLVAMMALGIKAGDEVITTPFTFIATGEVICLLGAKPVFVDIEPETYNISPKAIENAVTSKTKLIIAVSLYGQCAEYDDINRIADNAGIPVIEDACQSFGATYKGQQSCSLTTIGCTSFFPSKPLGGYGDAGACFTNDENLAKKMREIRVHGQDRRYHHPKIGINGRMDSIQAAVLLEKLEIFPDEVRKRVEIGERYSELLEKHKGKITTPYIEEYNLCVFAQYTIALDLRDELVKKLSDNNIPTAVHYPVPLHKQPAFSDYEHIHSAINSEKAAGTVISLPMHPYLKEQEQREITDRIAEFLSKVL